MPVDLEARLHGMGANVPEPTQRLIRFVSDELIPRTRRAALELGLSDTEATDVARITAMSALRGLNSAINSVVRARAFRGGSV